MDHRGTELQGLEGTSRDKSNLPAKAGTLLWVAQVGIQTGLKHLQRMRLHHLSGQLVPVLTGTL